MFQSNVPRISALKRIKQKSLKAFIEQKNIQKPSETKSNSVLLHLYIFVKFLNKLVNDKFINSASHIPERISGVKTMIGVSQPFHPFFHFPGEIQFFVR